MKASEAYAARMLSEYLGTEGKKCTFTEGANPPDYVFKVGEGNWAVEVTELHDYVELNGEQSVIQVEMGLKRIVDDIARQTADHRTRGYTVSLNGPIEGQDVAAIKQSAIEHIKANRSTDLICGKKQDCRIEVSDHTGKDLCHVILVDGRTPIPGTTVMHADIQATIDYGVGRILEKKIPRLRQLTGFDKRALCIVFEYMFADEGNVRPALLDHSDELKELDAVYLMPGDYVVVAAP